MENTISFEVAQFKSWVFDLIRSSYTLGMTYIKTPPSFSEDEAIKRFQEAIWKDLVTVWNINEGDNKL